MPPRKLLPATTQRRQMLPVMKVGWNLILIVQNWSSGLTESESFTVWRALRRRTHAGRDTELGHRATRDIPWRPVVKRHR